MIGSVKPNEISVVDLETEQVISTIGVGKKPLAVAVDSTRNLALVAHKIQPYLVDYQLGHPSGPGQHIGREISLQCGCL